MRGEKKHHQSKITLQKKMFLKFDKNQPGIICRLLILTDNFSTSVTYTYYTRKSRTIDLIYFV